MPSSACGRGGGEANAEARRAARLVWGDGVVSSNASVAGAKQQRPQWRPREAHAAAHLRIVPVDAPSTLDQPPELRLLALPCGLPHGLAHRVLGTGAAHLFSAVVASSAVAARESWPTFPDTQSEKKSGSQGPKGAKHDKLHEGASRHRPGSRVGHKGQRARPMRASANTSTPWTALQDCTRLPGSLFS